MKTATHRLGFRIGGKSSSGSQEKMGSRLKRPKKAGCCLMTSSPGRKLQW